VTLINWLVEDGQKVSQGQEVLEVETDKAVFNVEAVDDGYIHIGPYKAGDVVPVLTVVALIGEQNESFQTPSAAISTPQAEAPAATEPTIPMEKTNPETTASVEKVFISPRARKLAYGKGIDIRRVTPTGGGGNRIIEKDILGILPQESKVSPVARRMAEAAGLDLSTLTGSGPLGEITKTDVELALASRATHQPTLPVTPAGLPETEVAERMPLKGVRGVIAERMSNSVHTTARVTLLMDADATAFVTLREKLKTDKEADWGFAPGYNDLLAKVCACALRRFPYMNARLNGDVIERLAKVNIGIAVDAERGLYVPVIRDVDQKDLRTLGIELRQRVEEIHSGRIRPEHLSGGTFTITNLGAYEVDGFTPVINLPEAAILGVGRIAPRPVAVQKQVVIRKMVTLSLVFDHRLTDGAPAAKFLQYIKELIEQPNEVMLTM